jgi:hypothetical protein
MATEAMQIANLTFTQTHSTKRPTTVWNIYFGPIEQTVCPNTTGGDQQKYIYI